MASWPCGTEEAFFRLLLRFWERDAAASLGASGGIAATSATTGGAAASLAASGRGAAATSAASGRGAAATSAASGRGAAATSAASGRGAEAGPFFLLLLRFRVIGGLGLPLTAGGTGEQSVEWDFA